MPARSAFALLLVLLVAAGCELLPYRPVADEPARAALQTPFEIAFGHTVEIPETGLRLSFDHVEDSRCPADAVCMWPGEAELLFNAARGADEASVMLTLPGLVPVPYEDNEPVAALGHRFRLVRVDPYPQSTPTRKGFYRAYLVVEREP